MSIPKHAKKVQRQITIKDLFDKSGAVLTRCEKGQGGTYGYKNSPDSNISYFAYKTENSAIEAWFKSNFGGNKEMFKMIKYLIARANKGIAP